MTLPMVDLVAQIPPPAPSHRPPIHDPQVTRYCFQTGPDMKGSTRLVLIAIGAFVNPATGTAHPSFETIAYWAGVSKGTVSNAVKELRALGVFQTTPQGTKGFFEYTFVHMLNSNFEPRPREDRHGETLEIYRLQKMGQLQDKVDALERMLVDRETGELPTVQESVQYVNEREEEEFSLIIENMDSSSLPSRSVQTVESVQPVNANGFSLDNPPSEYDKDYMEFALRAYPAWLNDFKFKMSGAKSTYENNWPKFLEDLDCHHATVDHAPIVAGMFRCAGCKEIKTTLDSCGGLCGRCKAEKEYRNRPVHRSMLSTT